MTSRPRLDVSLYLVTDEVLCLGRELGWVVDRAIAGGVTVVQLRDKNGGFEALCAAGRHLQTRIAGRVPLIINDRLDVALAIGAEGVHVGQGDIAWTMARECLGPDAYIGVSVETVEQVAQLEGADIDYLGVSPIFSTPTKLDTGAPWGLAGLRQARAMTATPLVAIGGLREDNAAAVIAAGADGIAVVSAICSAPDPRFAASAIGAAIVRGRNTRARPPAT